MTINISLPKPLYADVKRKVAQNRYASVSELIRDAVRRILYPGLTENGFTKEFEDRVLKAEAEPEENGIEWNGRGSFSDFVLHEGAKKYGKKKSKGRVLPNVERAVVK